MANRLVSLVLLALVVLLAAPATSQPEGPALPMEVRAQRYPDWASSSPAAMSQLRFDPELVNQGRVVAVRGGRALPVTPENVTEEVVSGAVFVEQARPAASRAEPPERLRAVRGIEGTAYRLSQRITALNANDQVTKIDAWARDGSGLWLDGVHSDYSGSFFVALVNALNTDDASTLKDPVTVAVTARGGVIDPRPLRIDRLSDWREVTVRVPSVEGSRYAVGVSANPSSVGDTIELDVNRPSVRLWSNPSSIVGWGIGFATIGVELRSMHNRQGFRVPLISTQGQLTENGAVLDGQGQGAVGLSSSGEAGARIEVASDALRGDPLEVDFEPPWIFLGAALAGGLVGAFLRGRGRKRWAPALALGVASAVLATLAYAIGIDWLARVVPTGIPVGRAGEAVVFVAGAVAALLGVKKWLPSAKPPEPAGPPPRT